MTARGSLFLRPFFFVLVIITAAPGFARADEFEGLSTSLDECIAIGLERNYRLQAKREEIRRTELEAKALTIAVLPKLDVAVGTQYVTPLPDFSFGPETSESEPDLGSLLTPENLTKTYGATLASTYSFTTPDARRAIDAALLATYEDLRILSDEVRASVSRAYMNALLAEREVEVREESKKLALEQLRNAELRYEKKVAPRFEVIRAEVEVSLATELLQQAEFDKKNALKALYLAMGLTSGPEEISLDSGRINRIDEIIDEIENSEMPGFPEDFVEKSYAYRRLSFAIQSKANEMRANRNLPSLSGFLSWQGQKGNPLREPSTYVIGLNLNLRLFDSGEAKNKIEKLEAERNILLINRAEFAQGYQNRLEVLANDLEVALLTYETAKKTLESATEVLHIATIGYREGVTTSLELMDSRTQYLSAELNLFKKKVEIFLAYDAIRQAIGYERYLESVEISSHGREDEGESVETSEDESPSFPAIPIDG